MRCAVPAAAQLKPGVLFPILSLPKLEMLFDDGQRVWLYQVGSDWLARTVDTPDGSLRVDLRELLPADVEVDIVDANHHDRAGILFFELRKRFKTAEAFVQAVREVRTSDTQRLAA